MDLTTEGKLQLYLKIIEYKRSLGTMQWTVFSIFLSGSAAVFACGLSRCKPSCAWILLPLAVAIYWIGFLTYLRYRRLNRQVSDYLVQLEKTMDSACNFQGYLDKHEGSRWLRTPVVLGLAGVLYTVVGLIAAFLRAKGTV